MDKNIKKVALFIIWGLACVVSAFCMETGGGVAGVGYESFSMSDDGELENIRWANSSSGASYEKLQEDMQRLIAKLGEDDSDIVLITIGATGYAWQETPSFLMKLVNQFPDKKIKIYSINACNRKLKVAQNEDDYSKSSDKENIYSHKRSTNFTIESFNTLIPDSLRHSLYNALRNFIRQKLDQSGIVFIGNNTQAYSCDDVPIIAKVYYEFKHLDPHEKAQNLQLYTQGGMGPWVVIDPLNYEGDAYTENSKNGYFVGVKIVGMYPDGEMQFHNIPFKTFGCSWGGLNIAYAVDLVGGALTVTGVSGDVAVWPVPDEVFEFEISVVPR